MFDISADLAGVLSPGPSGVGVCADIVGTGNVNGVLERVPSEQIGVQRSGIKFSCAYAHAKDVAQGAAVSIRFQDGSIETYTVAWIRVGTWKQLRHLFLQAT